MQDTNTLSGTITHRILLGVVAISIIAVVSLWFLRMEGGETVLIPTLDLETENEPGGLSARLIGSNNSKVEIHTFDAAEAAAGFTALAGDSSIERHNLYTCPTEGTTPDISVAVANGGPRTFEDIRYWGYEYSGNEAQNKADGKTDLELFDGRFWLSDGELAVTGEQYGHLNTANMQMVAGKRYYLMTEAEITISCLDSDGDQLNDGREDLNSNGRVDPGETDPNNADSDGDGVNDGEEVVPVIACGTDVTEPSYMNYTHIDIKKLKWRTPFPSHNNEITDPSGKRIRDTIMEDIPSDSNFQQAKLCDPADAQGRYLVSMSDLPGNIAEVVVNTSECTQLVLASPGKSGRAEDGNYQTTGYKWIIRTEGNSAISEVVLVPRGIVYGVPTDRVKKVRASVGPFGSDWKCNSTSMCWGYKNPDFLTASDGLFSSTATVKGQYMIHINRYNKNETRGFVIGQEDDDLKENYWPIEKKQNWLIHVYDHELDQLSSLTTYAGAIQYDKSCNEMSSSCKGPDPTNKEGWLVRGDVMKKLPDGMQYFLHPIFDESRNIIVGITARMNTPYKFLSVNAQTFEVVDEGQDIESLKRAPSDYFGSNGGNFIFDTVIDGDIVYVITQDRLKLHIDSYRLDGLSYIGKKTVDYHTEVFANFSNSAYKFNRLRSSPGGFDGNSGKYYFTLRMPGLVSSMPSITLLGSIYLESGSFEYTIMNEANAFSYPMVFFVDSTNERVLISDNQPSDPHFFVKSTYDISNGNANKLSVIDFDNPLMAKYYPEIGIIVGEKKGLLPDFVSVDVHTGESQNWDANPCPDS